MTESDLSGYKLESMHEEHVATLDKLALLVQAIRAPHSARAAALPRYRTHLLALTSDLEQSVEHHFRFEEQHLFPLLRQAGKSDLADSLTLEHITIRNATLPVLDQLRDTLAENASEEEWLEFGRQVTLLIEMKRAHMEREETEMVPLLRTVPADGQAAAQSIPHGGPPQGRA
jgi:iron-sulfur cluster repair protein YtfE (RIC family)